MKKIYGISLVALFTAMPTMVRADNVALISNVQNRADIISSSYVQGAYNALGTVVNTKQDQLRAGDTDVNTSIVQAANIAEAVADASDIALPSEKAVLTAIEAVRSGAQSDNSELAERVTANENAIDGIYDKQIPVVTNWQYGTIQNINVSDLPNATASTSTVGDGD